MKKVFLVRFLENRKQTVASTDKLNTSTSGNSSVPVTMISNFTNAKNVAALPSVFALSVSITALSKAIKLVKRTVPQKLSAKYYLERF